MNSRIHQLRNELVYVEAAIAKTHLDMETLNREGHHQNGRVTGDYMKRLVELAEQRSQLLKLIADATLGQRDCKTL